jgi:CBS domain-containing protein
MQTSRDGPLARKTAQDLMTPNPVSIYGGATVPEVVALLADASFSAAPVIDNAGRPIGVVSRTDVVVYDRARHLAKAEVPAYYDRPDLRAAATAAPAADTSAVVRASDLMTPAVFSVTPDTPALKVAEEMARLNIHRMFVVDQSGILIGVISALDLLRQLHT